MADHWGELKAGQMAVLIAVWKVDQMVAPKAGEMAAQKAAQKAV